MQAELTVYANNSTVARRASQGTAKMETNSPASEGEDFGTTT